MFCVVFFAPKSTFINTSYCTDCARWIRGTSFKESSHHRQCEGTLLSSEEKTPTKCSTGYIILYYVILYYIMLYYIILYYITLYYIILHYITLYHIILYYITLYYIILYYTILYCIILYCIISYYGLHVCFLCISFELCQVSSAGQAILEGRLQARG